MATLKVDTGQITQLYPSYLNLSTWMQGVLPNSVMLARRQIVGLCFLSSLATTPNSYSLAKPSGKIMSAPASMYALDLLMHDSRPYTPLASVLAHTTNSPSETSRLAFLAICTFLAISSVLMSSLPSRCPHLLGNTWSYRCSPVAPLQKYSWTVLITISPSPKPVSASARMGKSEEADTSRITLQNSDRSLSPMSGTPDEAVTAAPEMQRDLKPLRTADRATKPLKAPGIMRHSDSSSLLNSLHLVINFIGLYCNQVQYLVQQHQLFHQEQKDTNKFNAVAS